MEKIVKNFLTFILVFLFSVTLSLSETFNIKVLTGSYQVDQGSGWVTGNKDIVLSENDLINLKKGTYLAFIDSNGKIYEINKSGTYSIKKIISKSNRKTTDVSKKYMKFIMDELGDAEDLLASNELSKNMQTLGAVERAIPTNGYRLKLPTNSYLIDDDLQFNWRHEDDTKYTFFIKNDMEDIIYQKELIDNYIIVDLASAGIKAGSCYWWGVQYNGDNSREFCIQPLDLEDLVNFVVEFDVINEEMDLETSMGQLALGELYKKHRITYKAVEAFSNACDLSPEVALFKLIYSRYLIELGLYDEADIVIERLTNM